MLTCKEAAALLGGWDDILVVCHANPDGDALGSMTGLVRGLRALGKRADWLCPDEIPEKFAYLFEGLENAGFSPAHTVTVDVADSKLLGKAEEKLAGTVELAVDHHGTHKPYSPQRWVEPGSAAAAEMVWELLGELGVPAGKEIANSIYTGVATDTGCFRHRNTTSHALRTAAEMLELGADAGEINQRVFGTKSWAQIQAERLVMDTMELTCGGKVALVQAPRAIYASTGVKDNELESFNDLPRQIEGVLIGVIMKEKPDGTVKASLRTNPPANAAAVCQKFGGGGHPGAAGCTMEGMNMEEACEKMKAACEAYLAELEGIHG